MVRLVVMAAGQATRMGQDKLVMPWKGTTILGYVLQAVHEAMVHQHRLSPIAISDDKVMEIVVVARHPIEYYLSEEDNRKFHRDGGKWIEVPNPKPLSETIRLGLQDLNSQVQYIGFLPGDQVGVTTKQLASYLQQVLQSRADFIVPMVGDRAVSPVFFQQQYVPELLALQGEQGGRTVLHRYPERWWKYHVDDSFMCDVDTLDQYNVLKGHC